MKLLRNTLLLLALPISLMAQSFEGKIVYKMSYSDLTPEMQQAEGMLPKQQTIWIKGNKSRFEQNMVQVSSVVISDSDNGTSIILMDMMGQKYKLDIAKGELDQMIRDQSEPVVKYVDGTKEIAGYTCKKAEITMDGFDKTATFWYTEKIPPVMVKGMEALKLKGMFMAYTASTQGMTISIEVTSVEKQAVSDDKFVAPDGYTDLPDQMKAMMGIK
jgi:GLPGLI family protein